MEWMPIESAPKGDGDVLCYLHDYGEMIVMHWDGEAWVDCSDVVWFPTHWMPLPPPPPVAG